MRAKPKTISEYAVTFERCEIGENGKITTTSIHTATYCAKSATRALNMFDKDRERWRDIFGFVCVRRLISYKGERVVF